LSTTVVRSLEKTQPEDFDLVILGGGTGSNIACLPSKNFIHSAKVASYFRRSKEFGITHDGFTINMADVRERKRMMVRGLNNPHVHVVVKAVRR